MTVKEAITAGLSLVSVSIGVTVVLLPMITGHAGPWALAVSIAGCALAGGCLSAAVAVLRMPTIPDETAPLRRPYE